MKSIKVQKITLLLFFVVTSVSANDNLGEKVEEKKERWRLGGTFPVSAKEVRAQGIDFEFMNDQSPSVPEYFDARKKWPQCTSIQTIFDQGMCSASWAVATAAMMSDRECIDSGGSDKTIFSAEDLLTCCIGCLQNTTVDPCNTLGMIPNAIHHAIVLGVVSKGCKPYLESIIEEGVSTPCEQQCTDPYFPSYLHKDKHFAVGIKMWEAPYPITYVQKDIMTYGPVVGYIKMTKHLEENAGTDIYRSPDNSTLEFSWHAVKVIGWGFENGDSYWLLANSWGEQWGELEGFFKVLKGHNHLGIETSFVSALMTSRSSTFFSLDILTVLSALLFTLGISK